MGEVCRWWEWRRVKQRERKTCCSGLQAERVCGDISASCGFDFSRKKSSWRGTDATPSLTFHLWVTVCVCCITGEIRKRDRKQSLLDYSFLWLFMPFLASVCFVHWRADRDSSSCSLTEVDREQTWYWWSAWTWHYYSKTCHSNGFCWTRNNCDQWYYW